MELLKYLIISLIQGFTEPLPISSSAHMLIFRKLLNINSSDLSLEIFLNFASMIAISLYLFTKRYQVLSFNIELIKKVMVATIPCIIFGFLFKKTIEAINFNLGVMFLITSVFLFISFIYMHQELNNTINYTISLKLGIFQSIALLPGISRMGSVLFAGVSSKVNIKKILDISNLMYILVSIGSIVLSINDLKKIEYTKLKYYIFSFIVTFIITYFSISLFYKIINKFSILIFSIYTLILGITLLIIRL